MKSDNIVSLSVVEDLPKPSTLNKYCHVELPIDESSFGKQVIQISIVSLSPAKRDKLRRRPAYWQAGMLNPHFI